jgi:hypothetical protein
MLANPSRDRPRAIPGTRLLEETLGVIGRRVQDPHDAPRIWEIQGLYLPVPGRALGGIRAKLIDQKGVITFCNQRDLEVLLGMARPGDYCSWADDNYVSATHYRWAGLCCDEEDLRDDLLDQEMLIRADCPGGLIPPNHEFERRVHLDVQDDREELFIMLGDYDRETGFYPDVRMETLERRWSRVERRRVRWAQLK